MKNISVSKLIPHEYNPRKDIGDIVELTQSIQKNGILQPLTVVPCGDVYRVVIGHRRLEAAKQAGIEEVPCEVKDLTEDEQLNVMMMENMLRENLTTYEEAKGFQLMLDLGKTVEQVADETGFSQSTIRNRTKLLSLNEKNFKESVQRGATLSDLIKLYDIEDEHTRNAVLTSAGTADFDSKLNKAVREEKEERRFADAKVKIGAWATEVKGLADVPVPNKYIGCVYKWSAGKVMEQPYDGEFYCVVSDVSIQVYAKGDPDEESRRKQKEEEQRAIEEEVEGVSRSCFELRKNYILNFGNFKKYGKLIMQEYMRASIRDALRDSWRHLNIDMLYEYVGKDLEKLEELPVEKVALLMLFVYNDREDKCSWRREWTKQEDGTYCYVYRYEDNESLDKWYQFLATIGYRVSQEEVLMLNGEVNHVIKEAA